MDCPLCAKGAIRVFPDFTCGCCGHRKLACDACGEFFDVAHGAPLGPAKLPPDHAITHDPAIKPSLLVENPFSCERELVTTEDQLADEIAKYPTVEEFATQLAAQTKN